MDPRFLCDSCGHLIEDAEKAMYMWDDTSMEDPGGTEIFVVHRGACDKAFIASGRIPSGDDSWDELLHLPVYLGTNIGIEMMEDWERAWESANP